jgi:threonine 3-dehydrogenase
MTSKNILITGANGEIGHSLIRELDRFGDCTIISLDITPLDDSISSHCYRAVEGDILDAHLLSKVAEEFEFDCIYHMAAILSTSAERQPEKAYQVNVQGTINLLNLALNQVRNGGKAVKFLFPSSVAVYGLPGSNAKMKVGKCKENEWCEPITMYGVNKLTCEHLGCYFAEHYRQLDSDSQSGWLDFRGLRFPGIISATTTPTGGTSDYLPEMLHYAAQGQPYSCFVREDTRIPFMAMPDAIKAFRMLEATPREKLTRHIYNVTSFNPSAREFHDEVRIAFPDAKIQFKLDHKRQSIVDSWPADLDDSAAKADWDWKPDFNLRLALDEYLIPTIRERYPSLTKPNCYLG